MSASDWFLAIALILIAAICIGIVLGWLSRRRLPVLTDEHIYPKLTPKDYRSIRDEIARDRNPQLSPMRNPVEHDPPTTYTRKRKRNHKKAYVPYE